MGFPLGVASLIIGYAVAYWATLNFRNGGNGPTFAATLGLSKGLTVNGVPGTVSTVSPNLTGQPPTTVASPGKVVET